MILCCNNNNKLRLPVDRRGRVEYVTSPIRHLTDHPGPVRRGIEYRRHSAHHPRQRECTRRMESTQLAIPLLFLSINRKRGDSWSQILQALVAGFAEFLRRPALDLLPIVLT